MNASWINLGVSEANTTKMLTSYNPNFKCMSFYCIQGRDSSPWKQDDRVYRKALMIRQVRAFIGKMDFSSPHAELKSELYVIDNTLKPYEEQRF